ncbi:MAG: tRNA dihydrouridine synthase [Minisyncoccia bacterium]
MNPGFWKNLKNSNKGTKPFFALAPMADVTDAAFRQLVTKYGKPEVLWTEFVSADGLAWALKLRQSADKAKVAHGRDALLRDLSYTEAERPIVAQLFSSNPENMRIACKFVAELGFDGIDINMGCPDKTIEKQGAGAAMIKTPELAVEIIKSAKQGIADSGYDIPLSVKTRVGYNKVQLNEWIPLLLKQNISALTVHARTRKEMSAVPANWDYVKQVVELRDSMGIDTVILGNGDVTSVEHGIQLAQQTGCDGVMVGRAIFGNPWLFAKSLNENSYSLRSQQPSDISEVVGMNAAGSSQFDRAEKSNFSAEKYACLEQAYQILNKLLLPFRQKKNKYWLKAKSSVPVEERLRVMVEHAELFEKLLGDIKNFAIMKKHFKAYVNGFDGAKELRMELMESGNNASAVKEIVNKFLKSI